MPVAEPGPSRCLSPRSPRRWRLCAIVLAAAWLAAARPAWAGVAPDETWQVSTSSPLPGGATGAPAGAAAVGASWRVTARAWQADGLPGCTHAQHRYLLLPAEGLFQGLLVRPTAAAAADAAAALGIRRMPVPTQRVDCDNTSIDLHRVAADTTLTALDGRVLTLKRVQAEDTPLAAVADLILVHVSDDQTLTAAQVTALSPWLSTGLAGSLRAWLGRPVRADEVPAINGDPFTDAQEYPDAYELLPARVQGDGAEVPVWFSLGPRRWRVTCLLRRQGQRWRLDDLRYADGSRLRQLLR
jgi:hypothetical protein